MSERELFDQALVRAIEMTSSLVTKNREQLWRARKILGSRIKASVGISLDCYSNAVDVSVSLNFVKDRVKDESGDRVMAQPQLPLGDAADHINEALDEIEDAGATVELNDNSESSGIAGLPGTHEALSDEF